MSESWSSFWRVSGNFENQELKGTNNNTPVDASKDSRLEESEVTVFSFPFMNLSSHGCFVLMDIKDCLGPKTRPP